MLVAPRIDDHEIRRSSLSKLRVLKVVGRRSLPSVIEATLIPAVLFYVFFVNTGPVVAMLVVLLWAYGSVLRRLISGHPIPGILQLALVGLTVRTVVGIFSGTFMYFLQPIAATVALGLVFLGTLVFGRPLIARMASDFCPLSPEVAGRPAVVRLFSGLTVLWAGVHLVTAGTTFALLVSLPTTTFVVMKSVVSMPITMSAILFTVLWSMRIARAEGLVFAHVAA